MSEVVMLSSSHLYNSQISHFGMRTTGLVPFLLLGFKCDFICETEHIDGFWAADKLARGGFSEECIVAVVVPVSPSAFFLGLKDISQCVIGR